MSNPVRLLLGLAMLLTLAGCGSGSSDTAVERPPGPPDRYFGDRPGQAATRARLETGDCAALAATVHRQTGTPVRVRAEASPPNSHCRLLAPGIAVSVFLDSAYAARQRYLNRMVEQVQFNAPDPAKIPHNLPAIGDRAAGNRYASWIPALSSLYAVRGNRWITVAYSAPAETRAQREAAAIAIARQAFRLTA
jgi:hypothetical protein